MPQAAVQDGLAFDPFTFQQDGLTPSEVHISRREVAQALVVAPMVVVLHKGDIAAKFLSAILAQPRVKRLLSTEHFSVDGTLIEAWASLKSFRPKDDADKPPSDGGRNAEVNFRGEVRSNATHASTTDPDAKLYRKGAGKEAKLCFMGHALMEN
jgi:hypothetical protein